MKANQSDGKSIKKTMLVAAMVIGVGILLFQALTQAEVAGEFKKIKTIPTSYAIDTISTSHAAQQSMPKGYKKANYTVGDINLAYYRKQTPTSKDMSKKSAAEIGAQALWKIYSLNLEGQVIEMGYQPATAGLPRSTWQADVYINSKRSYHFAIDSVTGELFEIGRDRTLNKKVSLAYDKELAKNPQEYVALAKRLAMKYNVVHSAIKSVKYNGQGYGNNDPSISIDITGETGELALMDFSRYDKALLGIVYSTEYKASLAKVKNLDTDSLGNMKIMRYKGESENWSAILNLTIIGHKSWYILTLTYKGSDINKVKHIKDSFLLPDGGKLSGNLVTLPPDGAIVMRGGEGDQTNIVIANDAIAKTTIEWNGKKETFVMEKTS